MTDRELKKLSREDLVEILLDLSRENDQLRAELAQARKELQDRAIKIENAGTLAEAVLAVNGVFEAAQAAADQYLEAVRWQERQCEQMERDARRKCEMMLAVAKKQAGAYLREAAEKKVRETARAEQDEA